MNAADAYADAKENWRVVVLAVFLVVAGLSLSGGLAFGLDLSGGTQVRAPLVGMTATGVDYTDTDVVELERTVADELGMEQSDVRARPGTNEFEVYSENVTDEEVAAALQAAGKDVQPADVEDRVSERTYREAKDVIETKLDESTEFSGTVQIVSTPAGERYLQVQVPGDHPRSAVIDFLNERGLVEVRAVYTAQGEDGNTTVRNTTVFTQEALAQVGPVQEDQAGNPFVTVTLTEEATEQFRQDMIQYGFAQEGGVRCRYDASPENPGHCLVVMKDGQYVNSFGMRAGLSQDIQQGTFGGTFSMETQSPEEAEEVRIAMEAGALPTDIALDEGTTRTISPTLADRFKDYSLLTGLIAALAMAAVVFVRYGETRVAVPMVLAAMAEVFILLGFAAATGLSLDLAHIAGFIAVLGTGVDDLVIIADEVLNQGDVRTRRVFRDRFRKAFWVIGAAAITTIIAMSPLMVLSLGDLSGFAVVTIVGVLIGVGVTRPAYGDVLRALMTSESGQ